MRKLLKCEMDDRLLAMYYSGLSGSQERLLPMVHSKMSYGILPQQLRTVIPNGLALVRAYIVNAFKDAILATGELAAATVILLALLLSGCAAICPDLVAPHGQRYRQQCPPKPQILSTIPPGKCSIDGGKTWFNARANGMCYLADAPLGPPVPWCEHGVCTCVPEANWKYNEYWQRCERVEHE